MKDKCCLRRQGFAYLSSCWYMRAIFLDANHYLSLDCLYNDLVCLLFADDENGWNTSFNEKLGDL